MPRLSHRASLTNPRSHSSLCSRHSSLLSYHDVPQCTPLGFPPLIPSLTPLPLALLLSAALVGLAISVQATAHPLHFSPISQLSSQCIQAILIFCSSSDKDLLGLAHPINAAICSLTELHMNRVTPPLPSKAGGSLPCSSSSMCSLLGAASTQAEWQQLGAGSVEMTTHPRAVWWWHHYQ